MRQKKILIISIILISLFSLLYSFSGKKFKPTPLSSLNEQHPISLLDEQIPIGLHDNTFNHISLLDDTQTNYVENEWVTKISKRYEGLKNIPNFKSIKSFLKGAQTEYSKDKKFRVTVAVPSKDECMVFFNTDLYGKKIQPVWLKIENLSPKSEPEPCWLLSTVIDPDFFSAAEVSWKSHYFISGTANRKMDNHFQDNQLTPYIPADKTKSGFFYTHLDMGMKEVVVQLYGEKRLETILFFIDIPGLQIENKDRPKRFNFGDLVELVKSEHKYKDFESLQEALKDIHLCASSTMNNSKHQNDADPINFAIIGSVKAVVEALVISGWDMTEITYKGSVWKMIMSSVFGKQYRYAPISPLYMFGKQQDLSFQKTRTTVNERNHLRIWVAPMRYDGNSIMVGQISRDIGVKLSLKSPTIVTHQIDPDVDETRDYLVEEFLKSQRVSKFGFVKVTDVPSSPRTNHLGSPYWTDDQRVVFFMAEEGKTIDFLDVELLKWETPSLR